MCNVFTVSGRRYSLKVTVLCDYFELSGQSTHNTVTNNHFLMISGEFGAEHERNVGGTSIGTFFPLDVRIFFPDKTITWNQHFKGRSPRCKLCDTLESRR